MESGDADRALFDRRTGAIRGAGLVQYAGMRALGLAARMLRPMEDLGFSYAARLLRALLPGNRKVVIDLDGQGRFQIPYGDGYWSLLLNRDHVYEEEVEQFLLAVKDVDYVFLDCGANFGYWSVLVTSEKFGVHRSVALEADAETYLVLRSNWALNSRRYEIMHRALFSRDGDKVPLYGRKHEARSIVADGSARPRAEAETICLDTLAETDLVKSSDKVVVKLDIEGAEIAALEGGKNLLERDIIVVYEDHGRDRDHEVTDYLMRDVGMRIYGYDRGRFQNVSSPSDLDALKTNARKGYDFFATKSGFWTAKMAELVDGPAV